MRRFEAAGHVFVNREKFIKEADEIERADIDDAERFRAAYEASQIGTMPQAETEAINEQAQPRRGNL